MTEVRVPTVLMDLIPQYLENRKLELKTLHTALQSSDFATIQSIGHKLMGNAGSYGFNYLTEVGMKIEESAKAKDESSIKTLIASYQNFLSDLKVLPA